MFGKSLLVLSLLSSSSILSAQSTDNKFEIQSEYATVVYKSELLKNNDLGTGYNLQLGTYAGRDNQVNFKFNLTQQKVDFKYADSSTLIDFKDTSTSYSFGRVYFGVLHSQFDLEVNKDKEDLYNLVSSGYGALLGLKIPFRRGVEKGGSFTLESSHTSYQSNKNILDEKLILDSRLDVETRSELDIANNLAFTVGCRARFLNLVADKNYKESVYSTYLGLAYSVGF